MSKLKKYLPLLLLLIICISIYIYITNKKTQEQISFEKKYSLELKELKKTYNIDKYIYDWNKDIEGYEQTDQLLNKPKYQLTREKSDVNVIWTLKDEYTLELNCPKEDIDNIVYGDPKGCNLKYNDNVVEENVRYEVWEDEGNIEGEVSMVIYSSSKYEYLVVGKWESGSKDSITIYKLEDGKAIKIPFNTKDKKEDNWTIEHPMSLLLYDNQREQKLVTSIHDPSMSHIQVFRIWKLKKDTFELEKTIGDIQLKMLSLLL